MAFPGSTERRLRYQSTVLNLNPGLAGTADDYVFSANGMYDPDITSTGHQPGGFDPLMLNYDHYTVKRAKISVDFFNADTANSQMVAIFIRDNATAITDLATAIENGQGVFRTLHPKTTATDTGVLTLEVDIAEFLGRGKGILDGYTLSGSNSANPIEQVYFHIVAAPLNATDSAIVQTMVTLEYEALFTEPRSFVSS
jgi:hypothetical protein